MSYRRYRSSRRGRRRSSERAFEATIYGIIVILFMVDLMFTGIRAEWFSLIGGAILLGSAIYQTNRRWRVSIFTWLGGIFLLTVGAMGVQSGTIPGGDFLPIITLIGVVVLSVINGDL